MSVERIELGKGLIISRVLTGLWQIADMERDGKSLDLKATASALKPYGEAGFTTFDMADHYGSAEDVAGILKKEIASDTVQLLTKWVPAPGDITKDDVRRAVQRSLQRLQSDHIDLMQFHAWSYADPRWLDCLIWLQELSDEGLISHLGLTNFDTAHTRIAISSGIKIVSNQVCYSLLDQRAAGAMADLCVKLNIRLLAFGTIAGGFLSDKWLNKKEPDSEMLGTWSQMKYKRFIDVTGGWKSFQDLLQALNIIAKKHHVTISNVASRYILDQPAVGGVILGSRPGMSEHIDENLKLFEFSLNEKDKNSISEVLLTMQAVPGDCGDEYRKPPFLTASGDLSHHVKSFPAPFPTRKGSDGRIKALSGTIWEDLAGFSRAIRKDNHIHISGTTATHGSMAVAVGDAVGQTHYILDKIEGALHSLGARIEDVVRTRIFIKNLSDWEAIARAHGERFKDIQPANTMVRADLIGDEYLVEIEAEAMVSRNEL